jgi:hypothetical protein
MKVSNKPPDNMVLPVMPVIGERREINKKIYQ